MQYDFDRVIDRRTIDSAKWTAYPKDVLPLWVADSDFQCPQPVIDAVMKIVETGVYGYPVDKAAAVALRAILESLETHPDIERVRMVCFDSRTKAAYEAALAAL